MTLVRWHPFLHGERFVAEELHRMLDETLRCWDGPVSPATQPAVNVYQRKGEVVVEAELPGVRREHIEISVDERVLTIRGEMKGADEPGEAEFHWR